MSERPWCGMCGGSCMRMEEHFGEVLDRETSCDECGVELNQSETHQASGGCSVFCLECWNNRVSPSPATTKGAA